MLTLNLAQKIREIQLIQSDERIRMIDKLFQEIMLIYPENISLLQAVYKSVCDNINDTVAIIELPQGMTTIQANKAIKDFGLLIIHGDLGNYISWDKKFIEQNTIKSIQERLLESIQNGTLLEETKAIQVEYPEMKLQLLIAPGKYLAYEIALRAKRDICIVKDSVYVLFNTLSFPLL